MFSLMTYSGFSMLVASLVCQLIAIITSSKFIWTIAVVLALYGLLLCFVSFIRWILNQVTDDHHHFIHHSY